MTVRKILVWLAILLVFSFSGCTLEEGSPPTETDAIEIDVPCSTADLIRAISEANAVAPAVTTINLEADCEYVLDDLSDSDDGISVMPTIAAEIIINGNQATLLMIKDSDSAPMRVFNIDQTGDLTLRRMTLTTDNYIVQMGDRDPSELGGAILNHGSLHLAGVTLSMNFGYQGGAIYNAGTLIISDSVFQKNFTREGGGAIYSEGTLTIDSTSFLENSVFEKGYGGAIYQEGGIQAITNSVFDSNRAYGGYAYGGGAIAQIGGSLQITSSQFLSNEQSSPSMGSYIYNDSPMNFGGGAIFVIAVDFSVQGSDFVANITDNEGGAINFTQEALLYDDHDDVWVDAAVEDSKVAQAVISDCEFNGNSAEYAAAAIFHDGGLMRISDSFFTQNGGVYSMTLTSTGDGQLEIEKSLFANNDNPFATIYDGWAVTTTITNTTFSQNSGPIRSDGGLSILFSTITQNTAAGLIYEKAELAKPLRIESSIVANNAGGDCDFRSSVNAVGTNLDSDGSCTGFAITADPRLGPLAANGGITMTHALLADSPAIGAASASVGADSTGCLPVDQRDVGRPSANCDLGAYEDTSVVAQAPTPTFTVTPTPTNTPTPEPETVDRCSLFDAETITITMLDIPPGTTTQTLYLFNPDGWPGAEFDVPEDPNPWEYTATLGRTTAENCSYQGYDGRLYCTFVLTQSAFGATLELALYVNECGTPIYTHPGVSIFEPAPVCAPNLGQSDCLASGGTYVSGTGSTSPLCVCP